MNRMAFAAQAQNVPKKTLQEMQRMRVALQRQFIGPFERRLSHRDGIRQ